MYETEQDLVNAFQKSSRKFLQILLQKKINRFFILEEYNSSFGIADIVFGTYKPYLSKKNRRKPINPNWANILLNFRKDDTISVDDFATRYLTSKKNAKHQLNDFCEAGFLSEVKKDIFNVNKEYEFVTGNIIAIEAKLKNWKRALFQAKRYKRFSDFSYVLLEENFSKSALDNIVFFKESNIGLITMANNSIKIHYSPNSPNQKKERYLAKLNEEAQSQFYNNLETF